MWLRHSRGHPSPSPLSPRRATLHGGCKTVLVGDVHVGVDERGGDVEEVQARLVEDVHVCRVSGVLGGPGIGLVYNVLLLYVHVIHPAYAPPELRKRLLSA